MDTELSTVEISRYTRMVRKALNISWKENFTNKNLYGKLPLVSSKIKSRRMKMAGYIVYDILYYRSTRSMGSSHWEPIQGKANRSRRRLKYVAKKIHWSPREARDKNKNSR